MRFFTAPTYMMGDGPEQAPELLVYRSQVCLGLFCVHAPKMRFFFC